MTSEVLRSKIREHVQTRMSVYGSSVRTRTIIRWTEEQALQRVVALGPKPTLRAVLAIVDEVLFEASFKF